MSKMKLLITGSNGFVAGSVIAQAVNNWDVHGISRVAVEGQNPSTTKHVCDLTDAEKLKELFNRIRPDAVIHAAAIANIDFCENNQEAARMANVEVTKTIVDLCKLSGARLVFC